MTDHVKKRPKLRTRPTRLSLPPIERTQAERANILVMFKQERENGALVQEAASTCRTPISSIYRWMKAEVEKQNNFNKDAAALEEISFSIEALVSHQKLKRMEIAEHLFHFFAWLRWPTKTHYHAPAVMVCLFGYLHSKYGATKASDLNSEEQAYLLKHTRLDILSKMLSSDMYDLPIFENFPIDGQLFDDRDALANICWYMLAAGKSVKNSLLSASLNKALYLLQSGSFRYNWCASRRTLSAFWAANAAAAPFLYVERFHSGLNFSVDPHSPGFAEEVDTLINNQNELRRFFGRCRWAIETLVAQLDPRALHNADFPKFGPNVVAEQLKLSSLPSEIMEALKSYNKS